MSRGTRYIAGMAVAVAVLYTIFVIANTIAVGPLTPVPLPGLSDVIYLQDALDVAAAWILFAAGAVILDRLLARDQALQTSTLRGMDRVTALAKRIAETGEFRARVPDAPAPEAVVELAATFNAMLARLEASFDAQHRLLADTSHELRNPLTVLRTNLGFLLRDDVDAQVRLEAARDADEEAARLGRLVDDLLLLARGQAGELLRHDRVRLDRLVADVVVEAQDAGTGHAVLLSTCQPTEVIGDAERLRQVLRNVVGNALRHTPARTRVDLALWCVDSVAELRVQDDGPGIAPEHLPHLFERFYRAEIARPRAVDGHTVGASSGAGLGLAIAKHIVEAHGGSIAAESAPGAGLVIRLRLPIAPRDGS